MQKLASVQEKTSFDASKEGHDVILHVSLQGALPPAHTLALHRILGILSYIVTDSDRPRLIAQQQFTSSEISLLLPLLDSYPHYCPYEVLFAHFYHTVVTDQVVARCRERLQEALEDGTWEVEIRPMRNMLSRVRLKMRVLGMEISSILETGYILRIVRQLA
jgi:hypothetical protein